MGTEGNELEQAFPQERGFLAWIADHDEKRLFLVGYVGLTLLLTIGISLFWLIFLVSIHFFFEVVKKYHDGAKSTFRILAWSAWDIKFDVALVTMALVLVVFTEISFGVAGLVGMSRFSGVMARFSGASRGVIPVKDLILAFRIICTRKLDRRNVIQRKLRWSKMQQQAGLIAIKKADCLRLASHRYPWQMSWSWTSKIVVGVIVFNLGLVAVVMIFGGTPFAESGPIILNELHPWPGRH